MEILKILKDQSYEKIYRLQDHILSLIHTLILFKGWKSWQHQCSKSFGPSWTVDSNSEVRFFTCICLTTTSKSILINVISRNWDYLPDFRRVLLEKGHISSFLNLYHFAPESSISLRGSRGELQAPSPTVSHLYIHPHFILHVTYPSDTLAYGLNNLRFLQCGGKIQQHSISPNQFKFLEHSNCIKSRTR